MDFRLPLFVLITALVMVHGKKKLYLVPKTQKDCLESGKEGAFRMGSEKLFMRQPYTKKDGSQGLSPILSFPGCFELRAKVEVVKDIPDKRAIMYHSFKWVRTPAGADKRDLDVGCTGRDAYGCGGEGNKCFYCDVCQNLKDKNQGLKPNERVDEECPREVGKVYEYKEQRCINDWGSLDKDGDGEPDFMKEERFKAHKQLLDDMKDSGYGSMNLKVYLSTTANEYQKKMMKTQKDILKRKLSKVGKGGQIEQGWAQVYKVFWLPQITSQNEVACVEAVFDVCEGEENEDLETFSCDKPTCGAFSKAFGNC